MRDRFRGFLPVVVDIETGGFNCHTDAILEIAIAIPSMTEKGELVIAETHSRNVEPFEGANLDPTPDAVSLAVEFSTRIRTDGVAGCDDDDEAEDFCEYDDQVSWISQSLLFGGRNRLRVYAPSGDVPEGFERVPATLEDAYLVLMRSEESFLPETKPEAAA